MFTRSSNQNNLSSNNNTLLRGNNEQAHQTFVKQMLNCTEEFQKSNEMHWAFNLLASQYRQILANFQECAKVQGTIVYDEDFNKEVRQRCLKIKRENQAIMMLLFNFKETMTKISSSSLEKDTTKESEYLNIQQRIRKLKIEITNKIQRIKENRKNKKTKNKLAQEKKKGKFPVMKVALTELKDAVEVVNRQLLKQKEEIRVLVKQLYDQNI